MLKNQTLCAKLMWRGIAVMLFLSLVIHVTEWVKLDFKIRIFVDLIIQVASGWWWWVIARNLTERIGHAVNQLDGGSAQVADASEEVSGASHTLTRRCDRAGLLARGNQRGPGGNVQHDQAQRGEHPKGA